MANFLDIQTNFLDIVGGDCIMYLFCIFVDYQRTEL